MGATGSTYVCQVGPDAKEEAEFRPPWALAQADGFATEDCPFCALRRSHLSWLNTEIKRLTSEVAVLETTIPPKFHQELLRRLEERPLPDSMYTGGVDDVRGTGCTLCIDMRQQVGELQKKAQQLDSQGKARIEFHREIAKSIEALLIEKRQVEAKLYYGQQGICDDGAFNAITKVNQVDEDALLTLTEEAGTLEEMLDPRDIGLVPIGVTGEGL
eukprot:TRINITY_DN45697_c0_g1_i2.p1 TRINITY_DN45697_c0_g1~~TRINITY_DN45697_c0_g1_i2.p1  ORF type:complete len:215 (+),score=54.13 TRINITY_DN45697_c0_g1_i2:157-801(+)